MLKILKYIRWRNQMIILVMTLLILVGTGMIILLDSYRKEKLHEFMITLIQPLESLLTNQISHNMKYHQPDHFRLLLDEMYINEGVKWVNVLDNDFKIVFSTDSSRIGDSLKIPNEVRSRADDIDSLYLFSSYDELPIMRLIAGIHNKPQCYQCHDSQEKHCGFIEIGVESNAEQEAYNLLLASDLVIYIIIIIFVSITIFFIHHRFFQRPYNMIQQQIKEITDGDFTKRIRIKTPGELQSLAHNVNAMATELENNKEEIESLHQKQMDRAGQLASVGELAASVAHEIRNPISGIRNALIIMTDRNKSIKKDHIITEIFTQINRVLKTVQDLLEFTKPQQLKLEPVELSVILQEVLDFQRQSIISNNIELIEGTYPEGIIINGDKEQLKQVITNILLNAKQATQGTANATIEIFIQQLTPEKVTLSIKNTGSWISVNGRQSIFKPFYTTKHKGSGLGLSLSKSIIDKHKGTIRVESNQDYPWTKFLIDLSIVKK
ncbi:MAG TPA: HAMP domain-containing sensor histidine kinase [Candidatus Marinimicrobia bacterium]|nr:HAMP domain-containing sensor histidine kinase [Candidatus Neomarinimicrobiota bacterium]